MAGRAKSPSLRTAPLDIPNTCSYTPSVPTVRCLDCEGDVDFPDPAADATCPTCGLRMYLTDQGERGRYPSRKRGALDYGL
jgi:hypothetical protein